MRKILIGESIRDCRINCEIDRKWQKKNSTYAFDDKGDSVKLIDFLDVERNIRGYEMTGIYITPRGKNRITQRDWDLLKHYERSYRLKFLDVDDE